jgi:hypothetical protein
MIGSAHAARGNGDANVILWRRNGFDVGERQCRTSGGDVNGLVR